MKGENDLAIENYRKAIELASPAYQAAYLATLGEIYLTIDRRQDAIAAYQEAVDIAEFYTDEDSALRYERRLSEIE